jgi:hypothetical protein
MQERQRRLPDAAATHHYEAAGELQRWSLRPRGRA